MPTKRQLLDGRLLTFLGVKSVSTSKRLLWRDGRRFGSRVLICSATGEFLAKVHAEEALRMCMAGSAAPFEDRERYITRLMVQRTPAGANPSEATATMKSNPGQRYCYLEKVGNPEAWAGHKAYGLKRIPSRDLWAYRQSQLDCLQPPENV